MAETDAVQVLIDFVEGRLSAPAFEQKVYYDAELERLLTDESLHWRKTYIKTNPYDFLIGLNYADPRGVLDAHGAVEFFLKYKAIPFQKASVYEDYYNLLLEAQPGWLDVDIKYLQDQILAKANGRQGGELKEWLRSHLTERFRYHKEPPKWIQSPAWPISDNEPLYFLGQITIEDCELFHDTTTVYVFLDTKSGETKTVMQQL
jgi:hypothetical protein